MKQLRSGGDMKWINTINIALAVYQTDIGFYAINNYLRKILLVVIILSS